MIHPLILSSSDTKLEMAESTVSWPLIGQSHKYWALIGQLIQTQAESLRMWITRTNKDYSISNRFPGFIFIIRTILDIIYYLT